MRTLSDLKKHAHLYEWSLIKNSWYKTVPDYQAQWREVTSTNTVGIRLKTIKNGEVIHGFLDWPKASELTIAINDCMVIVTINRIIPADCNMDRQESIHTMQYHLRPNLNLL